MRTLLRAVSVLALFLLTHTTAWAQATAQLTGTVRDESGAVLPGVTVTVTQTDTGFTRTVVTEGSGAYIIPNLRLEAFNVLNHVNWANPNSNYDSRNFGRVTAISGNMRIIQFGVKYGF